MKIYLIDLEPVETRYTKQWQSHIPAMLKNNGFDVVVISGPTDIPVATTPGAFLNFGGTNVYKANQVEQIGRLFCNGAIQDGDYFLFTDAWHPGIINLKYMAELLKVKVKIGGLWHAGSYDPADFLGRLIGDTPWVRHAEKSFYHALDHNFFATNFHIEMFNKNLFDSNMDAKRAVRTGWPMDYMPNILAPYKTLNKRNLIVFPHRIATEKQVEIFRDLSKRLPQYEFVVCQDQQLTKHEYHTLLGQAKIVFSASLQETLGIGCYEGVLLNAIPMVPDRLSYSEMYFDTLYPSKWTENWDAYQSNAGNLVNTIINHVTYYDTRLPKLAEQADRLTKNFFTATGLINTLKQ
jgi:hypothetical protein